MKNFKNPYLAAYYKTYCIVLLFATNIAFSQVGVNIAQPDASAELEIVSNQRGLLIPRMTLAQRNAILAPANGLMVFQTTAPAGLYYYNVSTWVELSTWKIAGNIGTSNLTNDLGTTDNNPLVLKTNNVERARISPEGYVGINTATPTLSLDINGTARIVDGTQGAGKVLVSDANGGVRWENTSALGFSGWSLAGNAGMTTSNYIGTSNNQDFVIKTNSALDPTVKIRVLADNSTTPSASGNVGIGLTSAPTSKIEVRGNIGGTQSITTTTTAVINGLNNNISNNTRSIGIRGESNSTGLGSSGAYGLCVAGAPGVTQIGVLGRYQGPTAAFTNTTGAGVMGLGWTSTVNDLLSTRHFGVLGTVNWVTGRGVYGRNNNLTIGSAYGIYCEGFFAVTGTKSASLPTTKGNQLVYCKESPEIWFEDFGFGQLVNGAAHIKLDELYLETVTIDEKNKMHITLQEQSETNGLFFIIDADKKGFTVKEKKGGLSNGNFSYSIMAKRRFYEDHRFGIDYNQPLEDNLSKASYVAPPTTDPMVMKAILENAKVGKETALKQMKEKGETSNFRK